MARKKNVYHQRLVELMADMVEHRRKGLKEYGAEWADKPVSTFCPSVDSRQLT